MHTGLIEGTFRPKQNNLKTLSTLFKNESAFLFLTLNLKIKKSLQTPYSC
mgnify:CR=1 FL=1